MMASPFLSAMGLELWARIRRQSTADPPQPTSGGSSGRFSCPPVGEWGPHGGFVIAISFMMRSLDDFQVQMKSFEWSRVPLSKPYLLPT